MRLIAVALGVLIALICFLDARKWNRAPQTVYRFFLLDGKLKLPGFVYTILAANLSLGNFLVFVASWGYTFGRAGLIWFLANLVLNVVGFRLFFPRCRKYIESHDNNGTIHDFLSTAYTRSGTSSGAAAIRLSASLVTVVGLLFAIVFELSLAVDLLRPASQLERITLFAIATLVICLFTAYGGFKTLITSDICQASAIALTTGALLFLLFSSDFNGSAGLLTAPISSHDFVAIGWPNMLSITVIGSGWLLVAMDQWQRTCASRSYDTSTKGTSIYLILISFFAVAYAIWGMYDKSLLLPSLDAARKALHSGGTNPLADLLLLPRAGSRGVLVDFIACGLLAAAASTTNTFLTVSSHSLTSDVVLVSLAKRSIHGLTAEENRVFVGIGRRWIVNCGMGGLIIACFAILITQGLLRDALSFFFIAYSVQFALLAPMIMTWFTKSHRPSPEAALVSILLGFIISLIAGFGFWTLVQRNAAPILAVAPSDWLTLTPVITLVAGLIPLVISIAIGSRKRHEHKPATAISGN